MFYVFSNCFWYHSTIIYIYIKENDHHKNQYVRIFGLKINLNLFLFLCNNENSEKKLITFI